MGGDVGSCGVGALEAVWIGVLPDYCHCYQRSKDWHQLRVEREPSSRAETEATEREEKAKRKRV